MQEIHNFIKKFGQHTTGYDWFRLTWSTTATEKRFGKFRDFNDEGLFLREVTELRETRKYNYIHDRWILERYVTPENAFNMEIPESVMGTYEPVYVFESASGEYLIPTLKVVEFIMNFSMGDRRVMNATERKTLAELAEDKEVKEFIDSLDCSLIQNALHLREAVTVL